MTPTPFLYSPHDTNLIPIDSPWHQPHPYRVSMTLIPSLLDPYETNPMKTLREYMSGTQRIEGFNKQEIQEILDFICIE